VSAFSRHVVRSLLSGALYSFEASSEETHLTVHPWQLEVSGSSRSVLGVSNVSNRSNRATKSISFKGCFGVPDRCRIRAFSQDSK
jgi:hypothetical protein